jgi:hypothetical protein
MTSTEQRQPTPGEVVAWLRQTATMHNAHPNYRLAADYLEMAIALSAQVTEGAAALRQVIEEVPPPTTAELRVRNALEALVAAERIRAKIAAGTATENEVDWLNGVQAELWPEAEAAITGAPVVEPPGFGRADFEAALEVAMGFGPEQLCRDSEQYREDGVERLWQLWRLVTKRMLSTSAGGWFAAWSVADMDRQRLLLELARERAAKEPGQ